MVGYNEIRTIPGSLNHQACARDGISAFSSFYYDKQLVENNVKLKVEKEVEPTRVGVTLLLKRRPLLK
jgi:hypothetical protein